MAANITPKTHGPLRIEGDFKLVDMTGKEFDLGGRTGISLCRCGHSANKPLCDGAHRAAGFQSDCPARAFPPAPPAPKP